jgi:hypothetical protein
MKRILTGLVFASAAAALCIAPLAHAADQQIIGKKLLIKNKDTDPTKNKVVILMKDPNISKAASAGSGDPTVNGGSVRIVGVGGDDNLPVPGPNVTDGEWFENGAGNLFKYRKGDGIVGDACKVVIVKDTKLVKAVCKGDDINYDVDLGANTAIDIVVSTGDENYCTRFGAGIPTGCLVKKDGSDGKTYLAKNCTGAPVACPGSPSGAFLEVASLF